MAIIERTDNYILQADDDGVIFKDLCTGAAYVIQDHDAEKMLIDRYTALQAEHKDKTNPRYEQSWDECLSFLFYTFTPSLPGVVNRVTHNY